MSIKDDWVGEKEGITSWPKLYIMDISRYYLEVISRDNLWQRLECEYKEGKAYRYYSNGYVGEVFINNSKSPKYCLFKAKCLPSQRVSAKQYDIWIVVEKDFGDVPGGKIVSGYCTCTAGLLGM